MNQARIRQDYPVSAAPISMFGAFDQMPERGASQTGNLTGVTFRMSRKQGNQLIAFRSQTPNDSQDEGAPRSAKAWMHSLTALVFERPTLRELLDSLVDLDESSFSGGPLSNGLQHQIHASLAAEGERTVIELLKLVWRRALSSDMVSSLCDAVGRIENESATIHALAFLTSLLNHVDVETRDAAVLALALLDDKRAIPALQQARSREKLAFLRDTIDEVIRQM